MARRRPRRQTQTFVAGCHPRVQQDGHAARVLRRREESLQPLLEGQIVLQPREELCNARQRGQLLHNTPRLAKEATLQPNGLGTEVGNVCPPLA